MSAITEQQARDYATTFFATHDFGMGKLEVIATRPAADQPECVDVLLAGGTIEPIAPVIMTCWLDEDGKPYGEW